MVKHFINMDKLREWTHSNRCISVMITHKSNKLVIAMIQVRSHTKPIVTDINALLNITDGDRYDEPIIDCYDYINNCNYNDMFLHSEIWEGGINNVV